MIEKTVFDYLSSSLAIPVYLEEPELPDDRYVLIEKVGSSEVDHIQTATITVRSYGESLFETVSLNDLVKQAMRDFVGYEKVSSCKLSGDYNYTDTETKRYRYQAIFDITFYE